MIPHPSTHPCLMVIRPGEAPPAVNVSLQKISERLTATNANKDCRKNPRGEGKLLLVDAGCRKWNSKAISMISDDEASKLVGETECHTLRKLTWNLKMTFLEKGSHLLGAIYRLKLGFQGRSLNMPE